MTALFAIAKRELFSLWVTPLAWILLFLFTLLNGVAFIAVITALADTSYGAIDLGPTQAFFGQSLFVPLGLLVFCPILTMRSLSDERRNQTAETLLSTQASATQIVLGKYLAVATTYVALWVPTLLYPYVLRETGSIEWSVVASSYISVLGLSFGFLAIGILMSSLTETPLIAAALTSAIIFLFLLCGVAERLFPEGSLHEVFAHCSVQSHLAEGAQGLQSIRRLVFISTLVVVPLFLSARAVENWRDP